jgi:hypothetical protein
MVIVDLDLRAAASPYYSNAVHLSRCTLAHVTPESAGARNRHAELNPESSPVRHPELDSGSRRMRLVTGFPLDSSFPRHDE